MRAMRVLSLGLIVFAGIVIIIGAILGDPRPFCGEIFLPDDPTCP